MYTSLYSILIQYTHYTVCVFFGKKNTIKDIYDYIIFKYKLKLINYVMHIKYLYIDLYIIIPNTVVSLH